MPEEENKTNKTGSVNLETNTSTDKTSSTQDRLPSSTDAKFRVSSQETEEEIRDSKAVLRTLATLREENKRLQSLVKNVDVEEYNRLQQLEAELEQQKKAAEEEELKKAQNWEELTKRKVAEVEQQYLKKI